MIIADIEFDDVSLDLGAGDGLTTSATLDGMFSIDRYGRVVDITLHHGRYVDRRWQTVKGVPLAPGSWIYATLRSAIERQYQGRIADALIEHDDEFPSRPAVNHMQAGRAP